MTYYPINETAARTAKEMMSFSEYKAGSATAEYHGYVDEAVRLGEEQKRRVDPMYHEKIDYLVDLYARKMAEYINRENEIGTRCPSVMISGGSNFPVRKKQRQVAAWEKNHEAFQYAQGILDKIRGTGTGGISSDDPNALDKLKAKLAKLERHQERMKAANAAIRMNDTAKGDEALAALGYTPDEIRQLREPDFCGRVGYPAYELSNNNANIHRVRERIAQLEKRQSSPAPEGWTFDGGRVEIDTGDNRIRILHDEKPGDDIRQALKTEGFRWSPKNHAWQRQFTDNALRAARRLFPAQEAQEPTQEAAPEDLEDDRPDALNLEGQASLF